MTVSFAGQTKSVVAGADGSWQLQLSPLQTNAQGSTMTVTSGEDHQEFRNLLVGEVWFASGQSNMQMSLAACARKLPALRERAEAGAREDIRWFRIDQPDSERPLSRLQNASAWQTDEPETRARQSALAYLFACELNDALGVPIGIIEGSWGGKPIEGFIPQTQFQKADALRPILSLAAGGQLDKLATIDGGVIVRNTAGMPGRIFNARVAPIAPFAVSGFLWYQGESNAGRGEDPRNYRTKMQALVEGWRDAWQEPELPFYFVQLPAFNDEATGWVRLREEQRLSLAIENTGMAVTIDLLDGDIHPANKLDVAKRLSRWALVETYGKTMVRSGPLFESARVEGNAMRVRFKHAESGLMVARKEGLSEPKPTPDRKLQHFELADLDGNWHSAEAKIDGPTVVVRSSRVPQPRAVRYACRGAPRAANLYNQAGLPASPFCSDLELLPWQPQR
ncbi:MAG: sialate O-acetylesterase [Aureliella sp.]